MPGIGVELQSDEIDNLMAAVSALGEELEGEQLCRVIGMAVREVVADHFGDIAQDSEHHETAGSLGATPTGFYAEARVKTQNTEPRIESDGVTISIDHEGLAQRVFGGPIEAAPGKALAIPATAEAYGIRPREFPGELHLVVFASGLAALMKKDAEKHEGLVEYWLVHSVMQHEDPSVLPTEDEMLEAAAREGSDYIRETWEHAIAA